LRERGDLCYSLAYNFWAQRNLCIVAKGIQLDPDSSRLFTILGVVLVCLLLSSFVTAYEAAFASLSRLRLQKRADQGDKRSVYLLKLLNQPHKTLLALMLSDWLADVMFVVLLSYLIFHITHHWYSVVGLSLLATPVLLLVGEILPRTIAHRYREDFVYAWLPLLRVLMVLLSPLVLFMNWVARPLLDAAGARFGQMMPELTEEEILQMVNLGGNTGMLDKDESELVHSAFAFNDTPAGDVLTPRVDMLCIEDTMTIDDALELMAGDEGYSRSPVYHENIDQIIGFVHIKDLLRARLRENQGQLSVAKCVRKVHHIHEFQPINTVLKLMQSKGMPMFIVTDEYGGTVGLITIEDILEEIVGEIRDEYDEEEQPSVVEIDPNTILVDARLSVSEINEILDLDLPNSQSVAGLVFNTLGEAPLSGQSVQIGNAELTVEVVDGIRILKVRVQKLVSQESSEKTSKITS
jgi:putative hemolysin